MPGRSAPATAQITFSSVKLDLSLGDFDLFSALRNETLLQPFQELNAHTHTHTHTHTQKSASILRKINIHDFDTCYTFMRYWSKLMKNAEILAFMFTI